MSIVVGGSIRTSADVVKAIALGADAVYIATGALVASPVPNLPVGKLQLGHRHPASRPRQGLKPGSERSDSCNLLTAWNHEIKELMGGMGINSIEALRGNRLMLRGVGLNETELRILGIAHAGE